MNTNPEAPMHHPAGSGFLRFDGSLIRYTSPHGGSFSVPLSEVAIIGEFTTDYGPASDDWFLVFVRRDGREWFEASMYAEGIQPFFEQLSATLGCSITGGLACSTDFTSRILWPGTLSDRPLFVFDPIAASGFLRRIRRSILPEISRRLSPDALSAIPSKA